MYLPNYNVVKTKRKRVVSKNKLNEYETFKKDAPEIPDFTCPHIDEVIDWTHKITEKMEDIRNMNTQLRDSVDYWKCACEEMQNQIDELQKWKIKVKDCVNA